MLKRAGFNLTKWVSNVKEVIERIPESEKAPSIKVQCWNVERALGVIWDTKPNCFVYQVEKETADTQRKFSNLIASLFDPIGFLSPFLLRAIFYLQQVWQFGIGWD